MAGYGGETETSNEITLSVLVGGMGYIIASFQVTKQY